MRMKIMQNRGEKRVVAIRGDSFMELKNIDHEKNGAGERVKKYEKAKIRK